MVNPIEITIKVDEEEVLGIDGEVYPKVTHPDPMIRILKVRGDRNQGYHPGDSEKLSEFMEYLGTAISSRFAFKESRPRDYQLNIKITKSD